MNFIVATDTYGKWMPYNDIEHLTWSLLSCVGANPHSSQIHPHLNQTTRGAHLLAFQAHPAEDQTDFSATIIFQSVSKENYIQFGKK